MSSKKNRTRNRQNRPAKETAAEQLTKQLENNEEEEQEKRDSSAILAEYERKVDEAEKRMAERLKRSEEEKAGKTEELPEQHPQTENVSEEDSKTRISSPADQEAEQDVKQFVPHISAPVPEDDASDETSDVLPEKYDEFDAETPQDEIEENEETAAARPNRFYLVFAVFVIMMSIVGVISTVSFLSGIISDIANRTDLKNEIALFLYPIVSVDPPDCDSAEELPTTITVEAAIWRIILTGDNSNYEKLYNTYMYVPAIDVEFSIRSIFGSNVEIKHQTVGTMDITFTYVEDMNSYLVPINPHYTAYSPRITDVTNVGETYTVTVEYIPPSALAVEGIEFEVAATKTMVYTISKTRNSATLLSIKNITRIEDSYAY